MYSLAGLFWRNDLGCASVIPSEQSASSYIIQYISREDVVNRAANAKKTKYNTAAEELRGTFTPLVCSTDGVLRREYRAYQVSLAIKLTTKWQRPCCNELGQAANAVRSLSCRRSALARHAGKNFGPWAARWGGHLCPPALTLLLLSLSLSLSLSLFLAYFSPLSFSLFHSLLPLFSLSLSLSLSSPFLFSLSLSNTNFISLSLSPRVFLASLLTLLLSLPHSLAFHPSFPLPLFRKINKIRCRKHSPPIAFSSCVCWDKACDTLIDLSHLRVIGRTTESRGGLLSGVDARALSWTFFSASTTCSTIWFATMSNSTSLSSPEQSALYEALPSLGFRKLQSSRRLFHCTCPPRAFWKRQGGKKIEAAKLADFGLRSW